MQTPVLVAGIGGASLGTEVLKSLELARRYEIYGCDISEFAYGHYQPGVRQTFLVPRENYVAAIHDICVTHKIRAIIPGGEEPLALLAPHAGKFQHIGVHIAANAPEVIGVCSDKTNVFKRLASLGIPIPRTIAIRSTDELGEVSIPCVIKPATGTGGSRFVFLAANREEARLYVRFLLENSETAIAQEYIPLDEGEFTIGVLSLRSALVYSIALRRQFNAKLSVSVKTKMGLISSGYSQGLIDEFPEICAQAEKIAGGLESAGPLNIQARVRDGVLLPFEFNPRFSATTYLRALAGFNEIDLYLQYILFGVTPAQPRIRAGYYLRSLSEVFVPAENVKR